MQVEIETSDKDGTIEEQYNRPLEHLKIAIKTDCFWIAKLVFEFMMSSQSYFVRICTCNYAATRDELSPQSELLCADLYPLIFSIENYIREYANRVFVRLLGFNWKLCKLKMSN